MADISKIQLPNGSEYNIKDNNAVRSSQTKQVFVQDTTPTGSVDGDIWVDLSEDSIPFSNGEGF